MVAWCNQNWEVTKILKWISGLVKASGMEMKKIIFGRSKTFNVYNGESKKGRVSISFFGTILNGQE